MIESEIESRIPGPRDRTRRGAAVVEFAFVAPFIMLMLIGMIEFGRLMIIQQSLTTAARQGAREAILPGATTTSVEDAAFGFVNLVDEDDVQLTITPDLTGVEAGDTVTVDLQVPIGAVSRLGSTWLGDTFTISANAVMRKEGYE